MSKKIITYKSDLFKQEITLTVEGFNRFKGKSAVPKKLEKANRELKGMKLPPIK